MCNALQDIPVGAVTYQWQYNPELKSNEIPKRLRGITKKNRTPEKRRKRESRFFNEVRQ